MDAGAVGKDNDIFLYDRSKAEISGIYDVIEFSSENITVSCKSGNISIDGNSLKIESFDSQSGRLSISGNVDGILYFGDAPAEKKSRRRFFG